MFLDMLFFGVCDVESSSSISGCNSMLVSERSMAQYNDECFVYHFQCVCKIVEHIKKLFKSFLLNYIPIPILYVGKTHPFCTHIHFIIYNGNTNTITNTTTFNSLRSYSLTTIPTPQDVPHQGDVVCMSPCFTCDFEYLRNELTWSGHDLSPNLFLFIVVVLRILACACANFPTPSCSRQCAMPTIERRSFVDGRFRVTKDSMSNKFISIESPTLQQMCNIYQEKNYCH